VDEKKEKKTQWREWRLGRRREGKKKAVKLSPGELENGRKVNRPLSGNIFKWEGDTY